jgi:hypothetical protein
MDGKGYPRTSFVGRPRVRKTIKRCVTPSSTISRKLEPAVVDSTLTAPRLMTSIYESEIIPSLDSSAQTKDLGIKLPLPNLETFGSELFEGLEYLLQTPHTPERLRVQSLNYILDTPADQLGSVRYIPNSHVTPQRGSTTMKLRKAVQHASIKDLASLGLSSMYQRAYIPSDLTTQVFDQKYPFEDTIFEEDNNLSYEEENMMLKHFFKNLLPLLDAHPNSPWPDLALKYCDFEIARSCFISLACIHIYECKGGNEYYKKGMVHINNTMDYLIRFISNNSNCKDSNSYSNHISSRSDPEDGSMTAMSSFTSTYVKDIEPSRDSLHLDTNSETKRKLVGSFVVLVLINVHVLFAVLEKGLSSFARSFFEVFASVCHDDAFYHFLQENEKKQSLVVVLSWYDTVSAIISPDCRLPFCSPDWYGSCVRDSSGVSTAKMMGCPGEIFKAMARLCYLRNVIHNDPTASRDRILMEYEAIKGELLRYRDFVTYEEDYDQGDYLTAKIHDYPNRLKVAQCWALATLVTLERTVRPSPSSQNVIASLLCEFIDVYGSMESTYPFVTQMVWPVYAMGCECRSNWEKTQLKKFIDTLYQTAQMGTLATLKQIVDRVWKNGETSDDIIATYFDEGIEYLPL